MATEEQKNECPNCGFDTLPNACNVICPRCGFHVDCDGHGI